MRFPAYSRGHNLSSPLSVKRTACTLTGAEADAAACFSHGRRFSLLPPQRQGLFRAPARALSLSPTAPFLPTAEEMGERTPAETAFLHFLSALYLLVAVLFFPHAPGIFLSVVGPPTVPAQLSAAAARCYGKLFCSLVLRDNKHITPRARRAHLPIAVLRAAMGAI